MKKLKYVVLLLFGFSLIISYNCSSQEQTKDEPTSDLSRENNEENINAPKILKIEEYDSFDNTKRYRVEYENGMKIAYRILENGQVAVCDNYTPNEDYNPEEDLDYEIGYNDYHDELFIPESVIINDKKYSVTAIDDHAFWDTELTSISIPKTITNINEGAFMHNFEEWPGYGTESAPLERIIVLDGNPKYDSREDCNAIIETSTNTLIVGCKNTIIPEGVKSIGSWAFCDCDIESLTIPASVETIGKCAFANCYELYSIIVNNPNLKIDKEDAFGYGNTMTQIIRENTKTSSDVFSKDASNYYYTEADLKNLSAKDLTYLRNSVFAKHGYVFKSQELNEYFKQFKWYRPDPSITASALNSIEKANVEFIKNYQEKNGKEYKSN